jgi:hypothetical protein
MSPDDASRPALEPTASLTSVRVKRRKLPAAAAAKRGDLTADGEERRESRPAVLAEIAADAPAILLPPPPAAEPEPPVDLLDLALPPLDPAPEAEAAPAPDAELAHEPEAAFAAAPDGGDELDILDYWDSLRGARDMPALDDLDQGHVAATWANTLLLAIDQPELPRITRLGENNGEIEYTAMVIDWIMARGRHSARHAEPMEEERRFAVSSGGARYRLLLLPVGSSAAADHVLCQLARVEELGAVASFRRWLAG